MAGRKTSKALAAVDAAEAAAEEAAHQFAQFDVEAMNETAQKMNESFRSTFEQTVAQSRAAYEKAKSAAEQNAAALEASFGAVKAGVAAINEKSLDVVKSAVEAQVAFAKSALGAKTVADFLALQGDFARKQVEFFNVYAKDFGAHAQKMATDAMEPIKARVEAAFDVAA